MFLDVSTANQDTRTLLRFLNFVCIEVSGSTETETNISSILGKEISKVDLQVVNKLAKKGSSYIMLEYMNKYFEGDIMDTSC